MGGPRVMMGNEVSSSPPPNETETGRKRAYLMLVIEVLTLRASATALPPSARRLLPRRLKNEAMIDCGSHDGWFEGNDEQRLSSCPPYNGCENGLT